MKKIRGITRLFVMASALPTPPIVAIQELLRDFEFTHRGHGGKHRPKAKHGFGWGRMRSKYRPHQGKRECARRVAQMQRNAMKLEARAANYALAC